MNFNTLLPNSSRAKQIKNKEMFLYVVMVEWGWSWTQLKETPLPVVMSLMKTHKLIKEKEAKARKKGSKGKK